MELIETFKHETKEVWIEEYENEQGERIFIGVDTSGSDYGLGVNGRWGEWDNYQDAMEALENYK
jgi:hypothetical protein